MDLFGPSLDSGELGCYRTGPFAGRHFGAHIALSGMSRLTLISWVPGSEVLGAPTK